MLGSAPLNRLRRSIFRQGVFEVFEKVVTATQCWPATAAGVERVASKAGSIVTALRNGYKTGTVEKLVFFLMNKEFRPSAEEVVAEVLRLKSAKKIAKAALRRQIAAASAAAAVVLAAAAAVTAAPAAPVDDPAPAAVDEPPMQDAEGYYDDVEVNEMDLGEVLEDEQIQAMIDAIADARVDPEAAAEAQAEF